jgi:hypothetical protein
MEKQSYIIIDDLIIIWDPNSVRSLFNVLLYLKNNGYKTPLGEIEDVNYEQILEKNLTIC